MFSPSSKTRWICRQCMKSLCSKRSYDEHMNIHKNVRPFVCDECDYAAASQMTLTRHRQRRHTPRNEWHYQCPYCVEPYMEPASYRQHVLARHYGHSATFGCPYGDCPFKCKSSKAFRDHLLKHQAVILSRTGGVHEQRMQFDMDNLVLYMVDDECGVGSMSIISHKFAILYDRTTEAAGSHVQQIQPVQQHQQHRHRRMVVFSDDGNRLNQNRRQRQPEGGSGVVRINVDELLEDGELLVPLCTPSKLINAMQHGTDGGDRGGKRRKLRDHKQNVGEEAIGAGQWTAGQSQQQANDWVIETEVVIGEPMGQQQHMPDGQTDDFGLD